MSRPADAHTALIRALCAIVSIDSGSLACSRSEPWCSVTFSGARHQLEFALDDAAALNRASRFADEAAEHEFDLPGHLVADMVAKVDDGLLKIEALTVEMD